MKSASLFFFAGKPRCLQGRILVFSAEGKPPPRGRKAFTVIPTFVFLCGFGRSVADFHAAGSPRTGPDRCARSCFRIFPHPALVRVLRPRSTSISSSLRCPGSEGKLVMQYHSAALHGLPGSTRGVFKDRRSSMRFSKSPLPGRVLRSRFFRLCRAVCKVSIASDF